MTPLHFIIIYLFHKITHGLYMALHFENVSEMTHFLYMSTG